MGKLIIRNEAEGLSDIDALQYVAAVMRQGRVSNNGKQYCYLSVYGCADDPTKQIVVATDKRLISDTFTIYKENTYGNQ